MACVAHTRLTTGNDWAAKRFIHCHSMRVVERPARRRELFFLEACRYVHSFGAQALLALVFASPVAIYGVELQKTTQDAFEKYVQRTEARIEAELRHTDQFLWVDTLPASRRGTLYERLRQGQLIIERMEMPGNVKQIDIPNGLIHHWVGVIFIPGVKLAETLTLLQDYNNHYKIYNPDVMSSKLLRRDGDHFTIYLRLYKKKIITTVFSTEHEVGYFTVDGTRAYSRSRSTRIAEVEDPGLADEHEKPVGNDHGFLWRINAYWRFQEKDGVPTMRELVCRVVGLEMPFKLVVPPNQKLPSSETQPCNLLKS